MARDRLAAIRAQQQQTYQRPSVPSPPLGRSDRRDDAQSRWQEQPRDFDPYAGDVGYGGRFDSNVHRDDRGFRGDWNPSYREDQPLPAAVPRQRGEPDQERRRGTPRYSISHEYTPPDFTNAAQYGQPSDPASAPQKDFDPRTMSRGSPEPPFPAVPPLPAQYQAQSQPQRSQYTPVDPVRTRQRSISGGRDRRPGSQGPYGESAYSNELSPPLPTYQGQHQRTRSYQRNVGGVPYAMSDQQTDRGSADNHEEKYGSSTDVGDGAGAEFEMRRRASEAQSVPSEKKSKRGNTIKAGDVPFEDMSEFFSEISDLQQAMREANGQIQRIQEVQMRLLVVPSSEDPQAQALTRDLQDLTTETRAQYNKLKNRIQGLAQGNANLRALIAVDQSVCNLTLQDVDVRQTQVDALKERFKSAVQRYAEVEQEHRAKNRAKMERQVKTVYPNLAPHEVTDVVRRAEINGGEGLFSQALLHGARTFAARGALREVENRAAELARIEQTLAELAHLFNDMATLVEAQDVQIVAIEQAAFEANQDMEKGLEHTRAAVDSARNRRKLRCVVIVVIIIVLIVVITQVVVPYIDRRNNQNQGTSMAVMYPSTSVQDAAAAAVAATITSPTYAQASAAVTRALASGALQARA